MTTRINKYLAEHGYCSRREADRLIGSGKVLVNGRPARLGDTVSGTDEVRVLGRAVKRRADKVYIILNKPVGLITTTDTRKKDNVISHIGCKERVFPVGRLDVNSSGLLLLTNDGELALRLMHPRYEHEKEYTVETRGQVRDADLARMRKGVLLDDGPTLPAKARRFSDRKFAITLREGRNRQIRRMCEALGYPVASLKRTGLGPLTLGTLKPGAWRHLSRKEIGTLRKSMGLEV